MGQKVRTMWCYLTPDRLNIRPQKGKWVQAVVGNSNGAEHGGKQHRPDPQFIRIWDRRQRKMGVYPGGGQKKMWEEKGRGEKSKVC